MIITNFRNFRNIVASFLIPLFICLAQVHAFTVVLDPGHGGIYSGARNKCGLQEKELTLTIAKKIETLLMKKKIRVQLTRTNDTQLDTDLLKDLKKRAHASTLHKADAFISLHFNNSSNPDIRGYELYVPRITMFKSSCYTLAGSIHHQLSQTLEYKGGGSLGNLNLFDRGIRAAEFNVLRNHTCPAVLIELEYITHTTQARKLASDAYLNTLAQAIAQGILAYSKHN